MTILIAHKDLFPTDTMLRIGVVGHTPKKAVRSVVYREGLAQVQMVQDKRITDFDLYESAWIGKLERWVQQEAEPYFARMGRKNAYAKLFQQVADVFGIDPPEIGTSPMEVVDLIQYSDFAQNFLSDLRQNWADIEREDVEEMYQAKEVNAIAFQEDELQLEKGKEYYQDLGFWEVLELLSMYNDV